MSFLKINNLNKKFSNITVLDSIHLSIDKGDIVCILGPSGMGKSTLLRCLAGLESIDSGSILLNNREIQSLAPNDRQIGFVFQNYALFPHMNAYENIKFFLPKPERTKEKVMELLDTFGLAEERDKLPHQLSGGQQQRLAVARSIAQKPNLLLMDEPFANLDFELKKSLVIETRKILKEYGITSIIITHDMEDAFDLADNVAILLKHTIAQFDKPYEIYHAPNSIEVAKLLGPSVFVEVEVTEEECLNLGQHHICGDIYKRTDKKFNDGQKVRLLIRPDDIVHNDLSVLKAKVVSRYFRGAYHMYELELDGKYRFFSFVPSHHNHQVGEWVGIEFQLDHLICF